MSQKGTLRTHTQLDIAALEEMQRLVDGVLAPNCIRKNRVWNLGIGVLALIIGTVCVGVSGPLWAGVIFWGIGLAFLLWGVLIYRLAAWQTWRQTDRAVVSNDYVFQKHDLWCTNGKGDFHYPYETCTRLLETEKNVYFITRRGEGVILSKEGLTGGTPEDLRAFLSEKCGLPVEQVGANWKVMTAN